MEYLIRLFLVYLVDFQLASALPATPEVNEDSSIRSISPDSITTGMQPSLIPMIQGIIIK